MNKVGGFPRRELMVIASGTTKRSLLQWMDKCRRVRWQTFSYRVDFHDSKVFIVFTYWPHHGHYQRKSFSFDELTSRQGGWRAALAQEIRLMRANPRQPYTFGS